MGQVLLNGCQTCYRRRCHGFFRSRRVNEEHAEISIAGHLREVSDLVRVCLDRILESLDRSILEHRPHVTGLLLVERDLLAIGLEDTYVLPSSAVGLLDTTSDGIATRREEARAAYSGSNVDLFKAFLTIATVHIAVGQDVHLSVLALKHRAKCFYDIQRRIDDTFHNTNKIFLHG